MAPARVNLGLVHNMRFDLSVLLMGSTSSDNGNSERLGFQLTYLSGEKFENNVFFPCFLKLDHALSQSVEAKNSHFQIFPVSVLSSRTLPHAQHGGARRKADVSRQPSTLSGPGCSNWRTIFKMLQNIPHQIVQSPARLGLPNPNSPSLQNPNPPKFSSQNPQTHQSSQPSNQLTTPPVSSTLLPLLPPLPRAQSLLLQMASLSSKLFEVSPNRSHWISAFRGSLPSFLSSQTQPVTPSPSSAKEIIAQFTNLQTQLFEAVAELQEILDLQDAKQKLTREIRTKDSSLLTFANKLKEAERVLDILVDDYSDYRRIKRSKSTDGADESSSTTTVATQLKLSDILSYAHKVSYTTFAPPEFGAGQARYAARFLRPHKRNKCARPSCIISPILILDCLKQTKARRKLSNRSSRPQQKSTCLQFRV
ncbi:hypothetical protein DH2020_040155 [Rehmannia glutinosa]|uniref:Mediator of RNA polymerase II transcription subunit 4 n=1 Tax=Rehmannia glutinosa TaxID=99300 RepID=A0ABR0UVN9_REHGL